MTNGVKFFLAFYILAGQPALLGRMLDNCSLYQLAGLNAGVFIIALIVSALCKPNKPKTTDNTAKITERSEEKVSRIENDNGVAVVSVEKKQEVVVEKVDNENKEETMEEGLVENKKEKLEEKPEEKAPEKPMRESVIIPKIVQPISGHQTSKKKKKEVKWGQRLILLLTLGVAVVIAWTLWEFLENRGIAIALLLGRILYLVIGKLFDVNGFYNAKKLFTNWLYVVLILAGIGYGVYTMQDDASFKLIKDKAVSYVKDRFNSEKDSEFGTGDEIYVFEGTGEVITDADLINSLDNTGLVENETGVDNVDTGIVENSGTIAQPVAQVEEVVLPEVKQEQSTGNPDREVTRGEAIKHLLQGYTLSTKTDKSFTYVAKSNELYPYFKTAQEKAMIGTDVNPSKRISCETYMSLKGILEGWNVNIYDKSQTRIIYWNKANELGKTNGCARGGFVKEKNL